MPPRLEREGWGRKVTTACSTTAGVRPGDVSGRRDRSKSPSPPAASFLLRFGWSSGPAIALYSAKGVVPHLRLEQTSYRFSESTLFERIALHDATIHAAADGPRRLREVLLGQTAPVIEALRDWSRMTRPGLWGQVTSSWGAQFLTMAARLRGEAAGVSEAEQFFAGDDFVSLTQPRFYAITQEGRTKYFHVRGACCRYYLAPTGSLCASCPILDHRTRRERNKQIVPLGPNGRGRKTRSDDERESERWPT